MNERQPKILFAGLLAPLFLAGLLQVNAKGNIGRLKPIIGESKVENEQTVVDVTLPAVGDVRVAKTIRLTVTAYSSTVDQTDADPFTTASGTKVHNGIIAHNFLPFGTRVRFPDAFGDKVFVVADRLNDRKGFYIADVWMPTREDAEQWGAPILKMEILES